MQCFCYYNYHVDCLLIFQSKHVGQAETLTLCGLHPYTLYDFQVLCKPRLFNGRVEGFWSKPASLLIKTDEDGKDFVA